LSRFLQFAESSPARPEIATGKTFSYANITPTNEVSPLHWAESGAKVPFLEGSCQVAVAPLRGGSAWHRNVQIVE
jgi:hypothetical protein